MAFFLHMGNVQESVKGVPVYSIEQDPAKLHSLISCLVLLFPEDSVLK